MEALCHEMAKTQLDRHADTLTQVAFCWSDFNERILHVNRYIYNYVEHLAPRFNDRDKALIREAMLNEWQRWSRSLSERVNKKSRK